MGLVGTGLGGLKGLGLGLGLGFEMGTGMGWVSRVMGLGLVMGSGCDGWKRVEIRVL